MDSTSGGRHVAPSPPALFKPRFESLFMLDHTKEGPFVIGFNGPPRSGKDTLATALEALLSEAAPEIQVHRHALAATMRAGAMATLGLSGGDKFYSDIKDKPMDLLGGKTFRRFMIDMSEVFVKKEYGQDFWARLLHARNQAWWNRKGPTVLIVTDIGFPAEVQFLCEHSTHTVIVQLDRAKLDFTQDSRNYVWTAANHGGTNFAYSNNETPREGAERILKVLHKHGWPVL